MAKSDEQVETLGWKPHWMTQRDGKGGWLMKPAQVRFLHYHDPAVQQIMAMSDKPIDQIARKLGKTVKQVEKLAQGMEYYRPGFHWSCPFGVAQMDNGEIIVAGVLDQSSGCEKTVVAFSSNMGESFTPYKRISSRVFGRPMGLTYLGGGSLIFAAEAGTGGGKPLRFFSKDYGRTWNERHPLPVSSYGRPINTEGNYLVDRDSSGRATRIAAFGWMGPEEYNYPVDPAIGGLHWSHDGGRTWTDELCPEQWQWEEQYEGKTYVRGISEGSLVRAKNGWIVAALRTDLRAQDIHWHNDNLEGTAVSVSKDDGKTWSPIKRIFTSGRMHANLQCMEDGTLVMTYIMRQDASGGRLLSYTRGCGAVVSRDNGLTWDTEHEYMLERFEFADGTPHTLACGHICSTVLTDGSIITTFGHYPSKGGCMVRWKPE